MKKRDLKNLVTKHDHIIETLTSTLKELIVENKTVNSNLNKLANEISSYKSDMDKVKSIEANIDKVIDKMSKIECDRDLLNKDISDIKNNLAKIDKFKWFIIVSVVGTIVGALFKLILKV